MGLFTHPMKVSARALNPAFKMSALAGLVSVLSVLRPRLQAEVKVAPGFYLPACSPFNLWSLHP